MKKVIINGATSMLGIPLVNECLENGLEVLAVVRPGSRNMGRLPRHDLVKVCECDLSEISKLPDLQKGRYDVFFHLAWVTPTRQDRDNIPMQFDNIAYTMETVKAAARLGCSAFVGTGSQAEYGTGSGIMSPETPVNPVSAYGIAKYSACRFSARLCSDLGLRFNWARVFSIYGPYGTPTMVHYCIEKLLKKERPSLTPSEQIWDFLYSRDCARAYYAIGKSGKDGEVYCIGSGDPKKLSDFVLTIRDAIDPCLPVGIGDLPYPENHVPFLCAGIDNLKKDTGFIPKYSFIEGVRETIDWVKSTGV
ncbi:MAG: NAD(P)-dependent oxidoreductase [Oligoflexales bacterium]|nr:NAD(P)-dependent oxidoreductase [Oligoflexales bacterium]